MRSGLAAVEAAAYARWMVVAQVGERTAGALAIESLLQAARLPGLTQLLAVNVDEALHQCRLRHARSSFGGHMIMAATT